MDIKLLIVDMDGTLLNSKDEVTPQTIQAFKKIQDIGVLAAVATGRNHVEAQPHAETVGAHHIMITDNGAMVKDYQRDVIILEKHLQPDLVTYVTSVTETNPEVFVQYHTRIGCVVDRQNHPVMKRAGWSKNHLADFYHTQIPVEDVASFLKEENLPVHKVVMSSSDPKDLDAITENLKTEDKLSTLRTMIYCLETIPAEIDKGVALRQVCDYLNIPLQATMAIGDSVNDCELLKTAGFSVAMGHAPSYLKELSDAVVGSNDENGVAQAIEKYILK